jgi:hypothetical protein
MWIDRYDDIFSDFDPRPYGERTLSDDFLNESRKMFKEKKFGKFELRILVPQNVRNLNEEAIIVKRLKRYFKTTERQEKKKISQTIKFGIYITVIGFILMLIATFIMHLKKVNFFLDFLVILFEPAGWFAVWYGLDQIFYTASKNRKNYYFFRKIANADVVFEPY